MQKGIRLRIYPSREQQSLIHQTFGCTRLIYNRGLVMRQEAFEQGERIGYSETSAMLTALKRTDDFAFLRAVDSIALQQVLRDLDRAYVNFFQKRAGYPRFKSKRQPYQSYRTINQGGNIRIVGKRLKLPKLGLVKVKQSMDIGPIKSVTIQRTPTGKYFAVLTTPFEPDQEVNLGGSIGIDVGLTHFYTDSNGHKVDNPRFLEKSLKKLAREQRRLSRKEKGSTNYRKQRQRVALIHEKVLNQRQDFLHKLSTTLVCENQTICVEDLRVKNMVRNGKLARHISGASWGTFLRMLEYKAAWYGNDFIRIPTFYPSSQTCSGCGTKNPLVKDLSVRMWACSDCGTSHDRDHNAAVNILTKGLQLLAA